MRQGRTPNTTCQCCPKSFYARPGDLAKGAAKYCSPECWCKATGRQSPVVYPYQKDCENCGEPFDVVTPTKRKKRFCGNSCARTVSNQNRRGIKYKSEVNTTCAFRASLIRENGHQCQYPNCDYDKFVDAHHIRPRKGGGANTIENGILLCPNHHREADAGMFSEADQILWATTRKVG